MEKQKNIPELRFPKFDDSWTNTTLKNIASKITDGTHDTPKTIEEGVPYLTAIHVQNGVIDYENCYYLPQHEHEKIYKRCNPEKDDLLLVNIGAGTANCAINSVDYEFSLKNVALIKPNKKLISPVFLEQYQRNNRDNLFHRLIAGGAQPFLSLKEIGKIKLAIPTLPEQQKIASFFTAIDQKITQLKRKKALLEVYKKGVMQKIFSQQIRFRDENGQEFPKWEKVFMIDIISKISTGLNPRKNFVLGKGDNYYVTIKNISNGMLDFSTCERIDNEALRIINNRSDLSKGDIIMSSIGNIGEAYLLKEEPKNWDINESVFMIRAKKSKLHPIFLYYILTSENSKRFFESNVTGSSFKSIKIGALKSMHVTLPSKNEQQKVANFLSLIDSKINHTQTQIEKAEFWKKGLLQKMFV